MKVMLVKEVMKGDVSPVAMFEICLIQEKILFVSEENLIVGKPKQIMRIENVCSNYLITEIYFGLIICFRRKSDCW